MHKIFVGLVLVVVVIGLFFLIKQDTGVTSLDNASLFATGADETEAIDDRSTADEPARDPMPADDRERLDLSNQDWEKVPDYVFKAVSTETLDLSHNQLSGSLPGEIRFLQNLKTLDLSNNQFTGVPAEVGQLMNLEVLDLSYNNLTGLPQELGNLRNLKSLNLQGNDYSAADLAAIKERLPDTVEIRVN